MKPGHILLPMTSVSSVKEMRPDDTRAAFLSAWLGSSDVTPDCALDGGGGPASPPFFMQPFSPGVPVDPLRSKLWSAKRRRNKKRTKGG